MEGLLYLENGLIYRGKGFGASATNIGELVFNTAMSGYQEMLTDPAAKGLVVNMAYPLIGNYGVSDIDNQSEKIHAFGLIARDISFRPSNRCSVMSISEWLRKHGVPGVYNVDTRAVTKAVRSAGTLKCVVSTEGISPKHAQEMIASAALRDDYMQDVGVELRVIRKGSAAEGLAGRGLKIAAIDFGIKRGVVKSLTDLGCDVVICPYGTTADEILSMGADGLLLPGGPGNPEAASEGIKTVAGLIGQMPVMGTGLGHLVLALAAGGNIYRMKTGHYGANHGVLEKATGKSAITSQGHGFAVDSESLEGTGMAVTHINLNDGTVEGMRHGTLPAFSVQFNPEGEPGPGDSKEIFRSFVEMVQAAKAGTWKGGANA